MVYVAGCEISAFGAGFIPGDTYQDRIQAMATADLRWWTSLGPVLERLNGFLAEAASVIRDEGEQVRYFTELLDVFEEEGVDTALWFTFAGFNRPAENDIGSYGVVRMLDATRWIPKEVFCVMAKRYARS